MMKAVLIRDGKGAADSLYIDDFDTPSCSEEEVLVKIHAASLNRADLLQREGKYPPPKGASPIMGLDCAGEIVAKGEKVQAWQIGDRVMALLPGGGYAEYASIPAALLMPIPEGLSFEEATCIPEVFLTAYQVMFLLGDFQAGQNILIHAGGSGVGTAAIQLARYKKAAQIIVTAGSEEKIQACKDLGAHSGINYKEGPFQEKAKELCPGGFDLVLDFIGAPYLEQNLKVLNNDAKLILIAAMGGFKLDKFNILPFLLKRVQVMGTTLRARELDYKINLTKKFWEDCQGAWGKDLKPILDKVFDWNDVIEAHRYMEANQNFGKIVLKIT